MRCWDRLARPSCVAWAGAFLALVAGGCRAPESNSAWERYDLWANTPQVETLEGTVAAEVMARTVFLIGEEVRDLSRLSAHLLERIPRVSSSRVRAIDQEAGSRASWIVTLGEAPFLGFRSLEPPGCAAVTEVTVGRRNGAATTVFRGPAEAPAEKVAIELADWEGQEVELAFIAHGTEPASHGCRAVWGSPALWSLGPSRPSPPTEGRGSRPPPNIVLIGADTLRADALGAWGRTPSVTPALDALAAESDVWLEAHSSFNVTNPSFASLFTGLYGKGHGVYDLQSTLPDQHLTLAELLSRSGYSTLGISAAQHLGAHSGLGRGFDTFQVAMGVSAAELAVDQAIAWLQANQHEPFFAWVHLFDPHTPHAPPPPFGLGYRPAQRSGVLPVRQWVPFREPGPRTFRQEGLGGHFDLYAGEVAYLDRQVDRLLGWLEGHDLLERTIVAFVSDHGENIEEHGVLYRHAGLWDTTTHVPLMVRWPGASGVGRRLSGLVQHLDLFPTLLEAAGVAVPNQDGENLLALTGDGRRGRRAVFSEHSHGLGAAVRTPTHRYFVMDEDSIVPAGVYFYDLVADPREEVNRAGQGDPEEARLAALLERWRTTATRPPADPHDLSEEERSALRALGYL